jgi:hypothetical protein
MEQDFIRNQESIKPSDERTAVCIFLYACDVLNIFDPGGEKSS